MCRQPRAASFPSPTRRLARLAAHPPLPGNPQERESRGRGQKNEIRVYCRKGQGEGTPPGLPEAPRYKHSAGSFQHLSPCRVEMRGCFSFSGHGPGGSHPSSLHEALPSSLLTQPQCGEAAITPPLLQNSHSTGDVKGAAPSRPDFPPSPSQLQQHQLGHRSWSRRTGLEPLLSKILSYWGEGKRGGRAGGTGNVSQGFWSLPPRLRGSQGKRSWRQSTGHMQDPCPGTGNPLSGDHPPRA